MTIGENMTTKRDLKKDEAAVRALRGGLTYADSCWYVYAQTGTVDMYEVIPEAKAHLLAIRDLVRAKHAELSAMLRDSANE